MLLYTEKCLYFRSCRLKKVFMLMRAKKGKSVEERLAETLKDPVSTYNYFYLLLRSPMTSNPWLLIGLFLYCGNSHLRPPPVRGVEAYQTQPTKTSRCSLLPYVGGAGFTHPFIVPWQYWYVFSDPLPGKGCTPLPVNPRVILPVLTEPF